MSTDTTDTVTPPPESVRVSAANGYSGDRTYHTTFGAEESCRYVHDGMQTWARNVAEAWDIPECTECQKIRGVEVEDA